MTSESKPVPATTTKVVYVRMPAAEYTALRQAADVAKQSMNTFCRCAIALYVRVDHLDDEGRSSSIKQ